MLILLEKVGGISTIHKELLAFSFAGELLSTFKHLSNSDIKYSLYKGTFFGYHRIRNYFLVSNYTVTDYKNHTVLF